MLLQELIVKLGLNSQDVEAKAGSATKKLDDIEKSGKGAESSVKGIGKASKDTSEGLGGLTGKLGAFLALLGGTVALKTFIRDAIDANTQLAFLSRNLGIDAQTISSWGIASQELGGTAAGLHGTLKMLSQEGTNLALLGESRLIPFFSRMRIALPNPQDPNGPTAALRQMAEYAERATKLGTSRTTLHNWFADFIPDEGTINLILQGTAALDAAQNRAKKWVATPNELATAVAMKAALADLEAQFLKIGYDMLETVAPALQWFFGTLQKIGNWIQQNPKLAAIFVEAAVGTAALGAAIALFTTSAGPLLAIAAAFTAVGSAILLVVDDYETWKKGGISEFDWSQLAHRIHAVGDAFEWVGDKIAAATDRWSKWLAAHGIDVKEYAKTAVALGKAAVGEYLNLQGDIFGVHVNAPADVQARAQKIAKAEGFGKPGAIPTRANNPGDIEYGPFAKSHGATGYLTAEGGKQIAVFPDVDTGWKAAYALLQSSKYASLSEQDMLATWQGRGLSGLRQLANSAALSGAAHLSRGATAEEKKLIHIAQLHIHTQATDGKGIIESLKRGMDFLTWGAPANGASQ